MHSFGSFVWIAGDMSLLLLLLHDNSFENLLEIYYFKPVYLTEKLGYCLFTGFSRACDCDVCSFGKSR